MALEKEQVEQRVREIVATMIGARGLDEVKVESTLEEDLGCDQIDKVEITMELEDNFDLEISDEDAEGFAKVQDLVDYVLEHAE